MPIHLLADGNELTRREWLRAVALAGASSVLKPARAEGPTAAWYALVSDPHVAADPASRHREQNMAGNLTAVVAELLAQPEAPAAVFVDGDLALKDGRAEDYARFLALVEPLRRAGRPLHFTPGNHDQRAHFLAALGPSPAGEVAVADKHVGVVEGPGVRFVMLDSLERTDEVAGLLGRDQLRWLAGSLDGHGGTPTVILVHHNPSEKPGALSDTAALMKTIRPRRQVKALVFGHSHRWELTEDDGIHLVNLPAVGYRFAADQPLGWVRFEPTDGGAGLSLRCIGGDRSKDGQRVELRWRRA
jgi:3',5'-cyclic-AMP phosphodiesterase